MKSLFLLILIMLASGCATLSPVGTETLTETSDIRLMYQCTADDPPECSVYKAINRVYRRNGVSIPVEIRCFWGNDAGTLVPGPCTKKEGK